MLDRTPLPKHPYARDNRPGIIAPGFNLETVDLVFLEKSRQFLQRHVAAHPEQPFFLFHSTQAVHLPSFPADRFKGKTDAGPRGDFIGELDFIVGELLDTLEQLGVADNTLVIFSSDNGPEITSVIHMRQDHGHDGARPWRGMKRDQWEGGHRVPLIVRWPSAVEAKRATDQTVCLTDLMATCAAVVNARLPQDAAEDSFDLLPILRATQGDEPLRPYALHQTISLALSIRRGPWKYLAHRGSGGNNYQRPHLRPFDLPEQDPQSPGQLYNLISDPGEQHNLYAQHPGIVEELATQFE